MGHGNSCVLLARKSVRLISIYINWTYPFRKDQPKVTGEPPKHFFSYENRHPIDSYMITFDVTRYVNEGQNRLAVEVYRWSDGSYRLPLSCRMTFRRQILRRKSGCGIHRSIHPAS